MFNHTTIGGLVSKLFIYVLTTVRPIVACFCYLLAHKNATTHIPYRVYFYRVVRHSRHRHLILSNWNQGIICKKKNILSTRSARTYRKIRKTYIWCVNYYIRNWLRELICADAFAEVYIIFGLCFQVASSYRPAVESGCSSGCTYIKWTIIIEEFEVLLVYVLVYLRLIFWSFIIESLIFLLLSATGIYLEVRARTLSGSISL